MPGSLANLERFILAREKRNRSLRESGISTELRGRHTVYKSEISGYAELTIFLKRIFCMQNRRQLQRLLGLLTVALLASCPNPGEHQSSAKAITAFTLALFHEGIAPMPQCS